MDATPRCQNKMNVYDGVVAGFKRGTDTSKTRSQSPLCRENDLGRTKRRSRPQGGRTGLLREIGQFPNLPRQQQGWKPAPLSPRAIGSRPLASGPSRTTLVGRESMLPGGAGNPVSAEENRVFSPPRTQFPRQKPG